MSLKLEKAKTIQVSIDKLWKILVDDFENIADWSSSVLASEAKVDATVPADAPLSGRVCQVPGIGATDESFTEFDAENYSFTFSLKGERMPGFVSNLQNRWDLHQVDADRTEVRNTVTADISGVMGAIMKPMMKNRFSKSLDVILADLAHYAEKDEISPAKVAFNEKHAQRLAG